MDKIVYRVLNEDEYYLWDEFIDKALYTNVFQTREYYDALKILKWNYEIYVKINEEDKFILGGCIIQYKKLPLINKKISVIGYGPVVLDNENPDELIQKTINYLKMQKNLYVDFQILSEYEYDLSKYKLLNLGTNNTFMIDLSKDLDEIFTNFSKTFRNCCRKAEKEGIVVEFTSNKSDVSLFIDYYTKMAERKELNSLNLSFLKKVIENLLENNKGFIAIAKYNNRVYNLAVISHVNKQARYLYGASILPEKGIPPIGQALHYEIIKKLKNDLFDYYDLGGVPDETLAENHPNYGVWKFKKGFGGEFQNLTKNYRIFFSNLLYTLFKSKK